MCSASSIVLVPAVLVLAVATSAEEVVSRRHLAETFKEYDYDAYDLDHLECRKDLHHAICPSKDEDHIPCSGYDEIEKYCRRILGEESVQTDENSDGGNGDNALEGCINYVSWEKDDLSCCPSNHCWELTEEGWSEWELVDADEPEEEGFIYEYQEPTDEDYEYFYEDEVEDAIDGDGLSSEEDSEDHDESNGTHGDGSHLQGDDDRPRGGGSVVKKPAFVTPQAVGSS